MKAGWKNITGIERYCTFLIAAYFHYAAEAPKLSLIKYIICLLPDINLPFSDVSLLFAYFISAAVN